MAVHAPEAIDVEVIRRRLGMSQAQFAGARSAPRLRVIERDPEAVRRALLA